MKKFLLIFAMLLCITYYLQAQTPVFNDSIVINQNFTSDTEIFPFNGQTLYGIGINGNITFNSDSSLVRIIISNSAGLEYMIYESYPMLDTIWNFTFNEECEETCFLNGYTGTSIIIQIRDASIFLSQLKWSSNPSENAEELQRQAKQNKDLEKIEELNSYIHSKFMIWEANETSLSKLFYITKKEMWGNKYNTFGIEYYKKGIFSIYETDDGPMSWPTYNIVDNFDWRSRHGANLEGTPYYDGDEMGGGWMTHIVCQSGCWLNNEFLCNMTEDECIDPQVGGVWRHTGACTAFGTLGAIEGVANLYFNDHLDFDLSEQELASSYMSGYGCNGVLQGGSTNDNLNYILSHGIVDEQCFPWEGIDVPCDEKCISPNDIVSFNNFSSVPYNAEEIKKAIIEFGPLAVTYLYPWEPNHAAVLVGFDVVKENDILGYYGEINQFSPWIGRTYWIIKNAGGYDYGENGFLKWILSDYPTAYKLLTPIYSEIYNEANRQCRDEDNDGYFNWGIGIPPSNCYGLKDGDDNNPSLGPIDQKGFCTIINSYNTSFENHFDYWKQSGDDDQDWIKHSGPTPQVPEMGPEAAQDGEYYIYVNSGENTQTFQTAIIESPLINFADFCHYELNFYFHKETYWGGELQVYPYWKSFLKVETSNDGGQTWVTIWHIDGNCASYPEYNCEDWNEVSLYLSPEINKIRFEACTGLVTGNCDIALDNISITPSNEAEPPIQGVVEWEGEHTICSNIEIDPDGELRLMPGCTAKMFKDTKIIVKRGGKLLVNDALITDINNNMWKGIEVWGTSAQGQVPTYQGWVEVINGGTIENSLMGIYTNKPSETEEGSWEPGYTGGIVQCVDAQFINNQVAAQFFGYSFTSASYFTDCLFKTNDDYLGSVNPDYFIYTEGMNQLRVNNCDFINETQTPYLQNGINSFNSILLVEGDCLDGDPCTSWDNGNFQNLQYGIYSIASTSTKYVDIRHTDFKYNYRGLYISGMTAPRTTSNRFYINEPFQHDGGYGMYLDHSSGYWVEDNDFIHEGVNRLGIGLIVHHSGVLANEIYRNRFSNLTQGISAQEQNKGPRFGLQIRCNDFDECDADILVPLPSATGYGIAANQGSNSTLPQNMAGNLFYINDSHPDGDYDDINNQAASLTYYFPLNGYTTDVEPIDYTSATVTKWGKNVNPPWTFENGCPSYIEGGGGGGGNSMLMNTITLSDDAIEANESLLTEIIDGGNTENLDADVENSAPPEAEEVYSELMSLSPYLSETVVSTSIEKENVLPNAMIRDVMVANPHTAKSDELIEKLDERSDPMPEYMKAQVLEGREIMTEKQSVEAGIANYKLIKARAFNELTRQYLGSAENVQVFLDSLEQLYVQDNELESKYRLAVLKLENGDYSGGTAVLDNLPEHYGLSGDDLAAHEQMTELFDIVSGILISGRTLTEADSSEVQQLALLELQGDNPANIFARNILLLLDDMSYDEPVQLPDLVKSAAATEEYEKLINTKPPLMIEVYPNPSKDFVIIGYTTGEETLLSQEGSIEIQDALGRVIQTITFKSKRDQVTVITKEWKSGIYIASLKLNGNTIESIKFTLVK
jgi:hypothetical protein